MSFNVKIVGVFFGILKEFGVIIFWILGKIFCILLNNISIFI